MRVLYVYCRPTVPSSPEVNVLTLGPHTPISMSAVATADDLPGAVGGKPAVDFSSYEPLQNSSNIYNTLEDTPPSPPPARPQPASPTDSVHDDKYRKIVQDADPDYQTGEV